MNSAIKELKKKCDEYLGGDSVYSIRDIIEEGIRLLEYEDSVLWSWLVTYSNNWCHLDEEDYISEGRSLIEEISKTIHFLDN